MKKCLLCALTVIGAGLWSLAAQAQELTPRAYWPTPQGTNALVMGYQYSSGDVVTDPSLPVTGVDSSINYFQATYQRTFSLFSRTANIQFNVPYTWGSTSGLVEDEYLRRDLSAMVDARIRLTVNLLGAPAMDVAGFQALRAKPRTIVGLSLLVNAPTGGYDADKLINAGTNRWAVKPALGVIWPMRPTWLLEAEIGGWFFGDNDEFLGMTRGQDPILSSELHVVKRIRPGFWASLDLNYYKGGRTTIDGVDHDDLQRNSRVGATVVVPFKRHHALRAAFSTGVATKSGGDYNMFGLSYFFIWQ